MLDNAVASVKDSSQLYNFWHTCAIHNPTAMDAIVVPRLCRSRLPSRVLWVRGAGLRREGGAVEIGQGAACAGHFLMDNFFSLKKRGGQRRLAGNRRRLAGNQRRLDGNRWRLEGNQLDMWVASD